ncbi:MAG TPA: hypothetical protein RMI62_31575, partial [Polyangiaceae bacterium LLY-WYZ-15_(1-7)]|nr:hypothetical protein [Polyangiaceae bacterium LLY-WYZ-15_(1-7)]
MRALPRFFPLALLVLPALACDAGGGGPSTTCTTSADCDSPRVCVDGRCELPTEADAGPERDGGPGVDAGPPRELLGIRVEPATASLEAPAGTTPTQTFSVIGSFDDGSEAPVVAPRFQLDARTIGDVDEASGVFTANGTIGGDATLTA